MSLVLSADGDELCRKFFALQTPQDIAGLLEVDHSRLIYHLYIVPDSSRYITFEIPKKSGGVRRISAPATALKIIQRKLNQVLQQVYKPKASVHSFVHGKSIVTNAQMHRRKRYVFNIDLKDFFPSINFGRVRGMFMAVPYELDPAVATILAQICCFNNQLPQGAPTSPIISNMICVKMDSQLLRLAQRHRCIYTRYADDITFSTSMPTFPFALAKAASSGQVEVGAELGQIISENGFEVNPHKVRLRTRHQRQEVTGLTVNEFPNVRREFIRQIRAMLHAWERFGLEAAEEEFLRKYYAKHRNPDRDPPSFAWVVKGKIEFLRMVRGTNDSFYRCFSDQLRELAPELVRETEDIAPSQVGVSRPRVVTEGKSDWKHLKAALAKLQEVENSRELYIEFLEEDVDMGSAELLSFCKQHAKAPQDRKLICVFDRDEPRILREVSGKNEPYKEWGNNVFSFALPVPSHRQGSPEISIELYFTDEEITRTDAYGKRLFLSNEFDGRSGRHKTEDLNCILLNKIRHADRVIIIDNGVFNRDDENVALPKDDFANYVLSRADGFDDLDHSEFEAIFNIVSMIITAK